MDLSLLTASGVEIVSGKSWPDQVRRGFLTVAEFRIDKLSALGERGAERRAG